MSSIHRKRPQEHVKTPKIHFFYRSGSLIFTETEKRSIIEVYLGYMIKYLK